MKKKILLLVAAAFMLNSCEDLLNRPKKISRMSSKCTMIPPMPKASC